MKPFVLLLAIVALSAGEPLTVAAQAGADHFLPGEDVAASFNFTGRIACEFADTTGVVLRSNWMTRHWIKVDGQMIEFIGDAKMSDAGWFQTFTSDGITLMLSLRRLGDRGETVPMSGQMVVARGNNSKTYKITGSCGA